jgi:hypothetical protein
MINQTLITIILAGLVIGKLVPVKGCRSLRLNMNGSVELCVSCHQGKYNNASKSCELLPYDNQRDLNCEYLASELDPPLCMKCKNGFFLDQTTFSCKTSPVAGCKNYFFGINKCFGCYGKMVPNGDFTGCILNEDHSQPNSIPHCIEEIDTRLDIKNVSEEYYNQHVHAFFNRRIITTCSLCNIGYNLSQRHEGILNTHECESAISNCFMSERSGNGHRCIMCKAFYSMADDYTCVKNEDSIEVKATKERKAFAIQLPTNAENLLNKELHQQEGVACAGILI